MRPGYSIAILLWLCTAVTLAAQAIAPEIGALADIAKSKDVVWLSLTTAIASIGLSAWLVKSWVQTIREIVTSITELKDELRGRPCVRECEK